MQDGKLTLLFHSCFSKHKTGFSRNQRAILTGLFLTGKYNIVEYATGLQWSHPECQSVPWKCYGVLPDNPAELEAIQRGDQGVARAMGYGAHNLDKVVYETKPDVIFSIEDFWGINYLIDKPYFNKINTVLWTTLDSLPLLPEAVKNASRIKNFYMWSEFAENEMHRLGHAHVKTLHGAIEAKDFKRLPSHEQHELRIKNNIDPDTFVIGFVFRNQLRKLVPNLFEGYADWKKGHGLGEKSALLLHTHFSEPHGWDIPRLAQQYGIDPREILTTYICRQCSHYEVKPFQGQELDCKHCRTARAQVTTNTGFGVTEPQLNEIYNLMDVYIHPFTSGGQEMPIQEAKLAELITLVTNYSCGEDMCHEDAGSFPLEWAKYTELGTQFIKASTFPSSIAKQLTKVHRMSPQDRQKMGRKAREWVLKNYSSEVIVKKIEEIIDSFPASTFDFDAPRFTPKNPHFPMPEIEDDLGFVQTLYRNVLLMEEPDDSEGVHHWLNALKHNLPRKNVYDFFVKTAIEENQKHIRIDFDKLLGEEPASDRILFCMPESLGDIYLCTSLFKSLRETYPDKVIYVATKPQFHDVIGCNPYVDRVIEWQPFMDNLLGMEGAGENKGYFDIVFVPHYATQRMLSYLHNGNDKIAFEINT